MQTSFFGTDVDAVQVLRWLYDIPEMRFFENHSRPDQPNRWFETWDKTLAYFEGGRSSLAAWPQNVGGVPFLEQITFALDTQRQLDAKGRSVLHSPALIRIIRNSDQNGCLAATNITCWNEKGVRQRSMFSEDIIDSVDWKAFGSIERGIQRKVKTSSPAKLGSTPIMPDAFQHLEAGQIKLWGWGIECDGQSPHIEKGR
ncbi:hypothetical protein [Labrys neptuniae]|uniref:Uncharacterized protein n=1 Tax=Labrys neptuniae TaxID=376174 RepID=A0ABV3PPP3_9HYPH